MFNSTRYSYLFLRLGLAIVFLWFGADKIVHPQYWLDAWVPSWLSNAGNRFGISGIQLVYVNGVFEILVGLSLVSTVFIKFFSLLAIVFLIAIIMVNGFNEVIVRDIGLIGGFLALVFWPNIRHRL